MKHEFVNTARDVYDRSWCVLIGGAAAMSLDDTDKPSEGVWQAGMLCAVKESLHPRFRRNPLGVVLRRMDVGGGGGEETECLALCKQSQLDTYAFANSYSGSDGCVLRASDLDKCR